MERIYEELEKLFKQLPESEKKRELSYELKKSCKEKYEFLKTKGLSDSAAADSIIAEIYANFRKIEKENSIKIKEKNSYYPEKKSDESYLTEKFAKKTLPFVAGAFFLSSALRFFLMGEASYYLAYFVSFFILLFFITSICLFLKTKGKKISSFLNEGRLLVAALYVFAGMSLDFRHPSRIIFPLYQFADYFLKKLDGDKIIDGENKEKYLNGEKDLREEK